MEYKINYEATFKICLIGEAGCGKDELSENYLKSITDFDSSYSIGVDFTYKNIKVAGHQAKLQVWNFESNERFKFLWTKWLGGACGVILFYDITHPKALDPVPEWVEIIRNYKRDIPILLVGCKADLLNKRAVLIEEVNRLVKELGIDGGLECSAKTGENVAKVFETLTLLMLHAVGLD